MIETVFVVVFVLVGDSSLPFEAASMSASSTAPTESIELSISNEDNSQMTDESPGVVVEVPPPPTKKHALLQKGVTIANCGTNKGIFSVGQQQWTIHKANKTGDSIQYISRQLL
jgi:hypothetical protein